ncbi:hypothetical protein Kpol_1023p54 [Vanderwaltozyma polyspora DSM 70294]|uniref:Signal recognition particle receptor subunit alpha homolog n=1 Tax=Vanderwaltozyma polyspora (strain ATCC 22028 / DSM 70294 / BCRC 21397 / CBS 2163 / NBRC 10782 / NRRL Y-8283 / UCD 57-17) TaxID=436907 RepID=A7TFS7_VANPO|nr:uncharacterized protein Kpol_1023p54 [Vanderwaltozyma polyspora DSM 70294]EDO18885.1 hypothetical protein Kpol_1023p54 [Vanderwaltozyma polyspora DSM 70294]
MFDQLVIFTPTGEVLYEYNPLNKKAMLNQVNAFISHLVNMPVSKKDDINSKLTIINVTQEKSTRSFSAMFHISKQPELYFVITYAEQSLELNNEAESTLNLVLALWDSLDLNQSILENMKGKSGKNEHNYCEVLQDLNETIKTFDKYFIAKYEDSIKKIGTSTTSNKNVKEKSNVKGNNSKDSISKQNKNQSNTKSGGRKWGRDGNMVEEFHGDTSTLDFSEDSKNGTPTSNLVLDPTFDKDSFGERTNKGEFLIKEIDDLLSSNQKEQNISDAKTNSTLNSAFGFLQKHLLGNKTITDDDLKSALTKLKDQLITKNVAPEAADFLTQQVSRDLVGSKTANWTSVENAAHESLTKAITQILTPGVSVDLLHQIQKKTSQPGPDGKKVPYVFSVVGVNGVGKSTNLSKLAFWLLQNNLKVLIVACDTFRSGAVEQLRVHVENLAQLTDESHVRGSKNKRGKSGNDYVELFEAGYGGSDLVTKIAKQAIKYASDNDFDIVLMDTAGRRHNDATLMSPLKSFAEQAKPDKIIMVGEALVGTDSVQQAKNFNNAFGKNRNLDFFIVSKCDTVGGMLGTMVNMVYATGIPILFVGVGQTYTDLRTLSVKWAVDTLMS